MIRFVFFCSVFCYFGAVVAQDGSGYKYQTVKIGITNAPPLVVLKDNELPTGMLIDFLKEVAIREKWKIIWVTGSWSSVFEKAKNKEIDVMTYIAFLEERTAYFNFSQESFITGWGHVYSYAKNVFQNILELNNKKVAVIKNEIQGIKFEELCKEYRINCLITYVDNYEIAFEMLEKRRVQGVVAGSSVGQTYESRFKIYPSSVMFNPTNALFATPKGKDAHYLETFDKYLSQWRNDPLSPYSISKNKWISKQQSAFPWWLKYVVSAVLSLLIVATMIVIVLRRQVKKHINQYVEQSKQLSQIINLVPHMIFVVNKDGYFEMSNTYASRFFALSDVSATTRKELIEKNHQFAKVFEDDVPLLDQGIGGIQKEIVIENADGESVVLDVFKVPFALDNDQSSVLTVGVDISEDVRYQDQIKYMAEHDDLTQLPNQKLLRSSVDQILQNLNGLNGGIFLIDLDYFKNINDSLGHTIGDKLLTVVGQRLMTLINDKTDMVARIGGDEFVILLRDVSDDKLETENKIKKLSKEILRVLSKKIVIENHELYISASMGIVIYPDAAKNYDQAMQRADIAMYHAKSHGRNGYVVFQDTMEKAILRKHQLAGELHKAINNNDFILKYQPQITKDNNEIIGLEALIRWQHDNGEIIKPNEFIHFAEECGLIIPIGNWVLEEVFKQIKHWLNRHQNVPFVTVNLSVIQLHKSGLVDFLQSLFDKYQVPPHLIELELTETVMVEQVKETIKTLFKLKKLGLRLSIDDFGTGYSSLSYLKKLPFDKLKIDYSFTKDIVPDPETKTIVQAIINMSKDLGLEIIAEGVESKEQLDMLIEMGCQNFQGFYFDEPNSAEYIENKYLFS